MHTFFINTSKKELENYSDIFEIQHETRRLVSLECPLAEWNDEERGYQACVRKMGELIDSYKDINNDFNLILYIDLLAYEKYTSIPMNKHRERYACLKALHSVLQHYIKSTLVAELNECGRDPREILLIFEENQQPRDGDENTEDGKNLLRAYAREFLGLPGEEEVNKIAYKKDGTQLTPEMFCEGTRAYGRSCLGEKVLQCYMEQVDTFLSEVQKFDTSEPAVKRLLDRVMSCSGDDDMVVSSVSFVTNRRAGIANKQERTRRNLRLCFYILKCVEEETVFDNTAAGSGNIRAAKAFPEINWDEVALELATKSAVFQKKYNETQRLSESFSEMKLAPPLYAFDNKRFALDEYGKREKTFDIVDVTEAADEEQEGKDREERIIRLKDKKLVEVSNVKGRSLFSKEEYPLFDYKAEDIDEGLNKNASVEQYVAQAQKLRRHHLDYLNSLKSHITDRLSNYAGRSVENEPALLRKRKVSVAEEDFDDAGRDYRYAMPGRLEETKKLKTVESISETAYASALLEYTEFCAGRSVAITDLEEQCNWFVTRVNQIRDSLKKIKLVAVGLLAAIIVLYLPFVILQWDHIWESPNAMLVAALSLAIPLVLIYLVFAIASAFQRKKFRKAWNEFREKSDRALQENALAAEKYDQLLSVYIPTLRWVYEYKLDVGFYADCCKMARAKIGHHLQKLHDRVVTIGNIIEDLEADPSVREQAAARSRRNLHDEIDYNVSFCTGKKNRKFYSVIDTHFLDTIHK